MPPRWRVKVHSNLQSTASCSGLSHQNRQDLSSLHCLLCINNLFHRDEVVTEIICLIQQIMLPPSKQKKEINALGLIFLFLIQLSFIKISGTSSVDGPSSLNVWIGLLNCLIEGGFQSEYQSLFFRECIYMGSDLVFVFFQRFVKLHTGRSPPVQTSSETNHMVCLGSIARCN